MKFLLTISCFILSTLLFGQADEDFRFSYRLGVETSLISTDIQRFDFVTTSPNTPIHEHVELQFNYRPIGVQFLGFDFSFPNKFSVAVFEVSAGGTGKRLSYINSNIIGCGYEFRLVNAHRVQDPFILERGFLNLKAGVSFSGFRSIYKSDSINSETGNSIKVNAQNLGKMMYYELAENQFRFVPNLALKCNVSENIFIELQCLYNLTFFHKGSIILYKRGSTSERKVQGNYSDYLFDSAKTPINQTIFNTGQFSFRLNVGIQIN